MTTTVSAEEPQQSFSHGIPLGDVVRDVATLGTGTVLAGLFNVLLVFVIPKLLSVEDYGYWRLFALYAGYIGFLHFGFADGALLRWAGRPLKDFHHEIRPALTYLFWQHLAVLVPSCVIVLIVLPGPLRFIAVAIAIYALIFNELTLLQYGLQSAKIFHPVAISTMAAPALFLGMVLLWHAKWQSNYREVIGLYTMGWLAAMVYLWMRTDQGGSEQGSAVEDGFARGCLLNGWPIVMANTAVMLIVCADRLALSWATTIQNFAQYSLAASAMAVPIMAIQACSKVFFSHLAGVPPQERRKIYGVCSRTLLVAWALLLPYYFVLDVFIRHALPKYTPSLQYARILLLGIPFLASIQILQMSYIYLNGMQKRFLGQTIAVLALSLGVTSLAAFYASSLRIVAGVQVAILGGWWAFNEGTLRLLTGVTLSGWARFLGLYGLASGIFWIVTKHVALTARSSVFAYYGCMVVVLGVLCRTDLSLCSSLFVEQCDAGMRQASRGD